MGRLIRQFLISGLLLMGAIVFLGTPVASLLVDVGMLPGMVAKQAHIWIPVTVNLLALLVSVYVLDSAIGFSRNSWYAFLDFWDERRVWMKGILWAILSIWLLLNLHEMLPFLLKRVGFSRMVSEYWVFLGAYLPEGLIHLPVYMINLVLVILSVIVAVVLHLRENDEVVRNVGFNRRTITFASKNSNGVHVNPKELKLLAKAEKKIEKGQLVGAAKIFDKLGNEFCYRAGKLYSQHGEAEKANASYLNAGNYFMDKGNYLRAGDAYYFGQHWQKAVDAYARMVMPSEKDVDKDLLVQLADRRGESLYRVERYEEAAHLYLKYELFAAAGEAFQRADMPTDAAHAFSQAGAFEESFRALEAGGFGELALLERGKYLIHQGKYAEAALEFEKVKHYEYAAEAYVKGSLPAKAARCFMLADKPSRAAEYFLGAGEEMQALGCYERMGDFDKAAQLAAHMGLQDKQAEYYEKGGYLLPAAHAYLVIYETENAVRCLEQLEIRDEATASACAQILTALLDAGRVKEAMACAYGLLEGKRSKRLLAPLLFALARIQESLGKFEKALKFYVKTANLCPENEEYVGAAKRLAVKLDVPFEPKTEKSKEKASDPKKSSLIVPPEENPVAHLAPKVEAAEQPVPDNMYTQIAPEEAIQAQVEKNEAPEAGGDDVTLTIDENTIYDLTSEGDLSRYQVIKELGRGGMGYVYKAHDKKLNRPVALKMLHAEMNQEPRVVLFFKREAKTIAQLNHPNLVSLFDLGKERGCFYMVMEYVSGLTLQQLVKKYPQYVRRNLPAIWLEACSGIRYAHDSGILHRDLKPSNIMFTKDRRIKILDFGLAKDIADISHTKQVWGTPSYMAPELFQGERAGFSTDVYGLGATFYTLATRKEPFTASSLGLKFEGEGLPLAPHEIDPRVDQDLSWIILKCMNLNPKARYQSIEALMIDLRKLGR